jgi:hypothetical protein
MAFWGLLGGCLATGFFFIYYFPEKGIDGKGGMD